MAMMLPEHVEALKEWMEEDYYVENPQLDDFDLENIQENIDIALNGSAKRMLQLGGMVRYGTTVGR